MTHSSARSQNPPPAVPIKDNEQLEFLGDAILSFLVAEALVKRFQNDAEGLLSGRKNMIVSAQHLHEAAAGLGLGDFMILSSGEQKQGARTRPGVLADAMEALLAAVYLDAGIEAARQLVECHILGNGVFLDRAELISPRDAKTLLQEWAVRAGLPWPTYATVAESGPGHAREFTVEVRIGEQHTALGQGSSKKEASKRAAEQLVERLQVRG
jgi:ribonuclease-3